tara:strand:+ start:1439 stop:2950 length:1512 start_codon:yes stop_codon:yes gene_type:complete
MNNKNITNFDEIASSFGGDLYEFNDGNYKDLDETAPGDRDWDAVSDGPAHENNCVGNIDEAQLTDQTSACPDGMNDDDVNEDVPPWDGPSDSPQPSPDDNIDDEGIEDLNDAMSNIMEEMESILDDSSSEDAETNYQEECSMPPDSGDSEESSNNKEKESEEDGDQKELEESIEESESVKEMEDLMSQQPEAPAIIDPPENKEKAKHKLGKIYEHVIRADDSIEKWNRKYKNRLPLLCSNGLIIKDYHYLLPKVLRIILAHWKEEEHAPPILLFGGAGCGKSMLISGVCQVLGSDLFRNNFGPTTTESVIDGYKNVINGDYVNGILREPYEFGHMANWEEVDAAEGGVLPFANTPLSDDQFRFSDGIVTEKHKRFLMIASSNTNGTGAASGYIRNPMDSAFLDRFVKIESGYDQGLELQLTDNNPITSICHKVRDKLDQRPTKVVLSFRSIINCIKLDKWGICKDPVEQAHKTWGYQLEKEEVAQILNQVRKSIAKKPIGGTS